MPMGICGNALFHDKNITYIDNHTCLIAHVFKVLVDVFKGKIIFHKTFYKFRILFNKIAIK